MRKKALLLMIFMTILASLFADSFRFSIVWENVITSETSMSVVAYTEDTTLGEKPLMQTTQTQNVARIKYSTNEGGTHKLVYKATPLMSDSDNKCYGFNLYFNYPATDPTQTATINVLDNRNLVYPTGQLEGSAYTNLAMGASGTMTTQYVGIQVKVTDLDSMKQNIQYASTITIEKVTN